MKRISVAILLAAPLCLLCSMGFAQDRYRPPYGPTMSPYLDYFRVQPGVLPNYYQFIRPERELRQSISQINRSIGQEQTQINDLRKDMKRGQQTIKPADASPTGKAGSFQNYSHYYTK